MPDLEKILPHKPPMILIDELVSIDLEQKIAVAKFVVTDKKMFYDKQLGGIPSICGIEFMAQTIGCFAYYKNRRSEPQIGFLLGSRLYNNLTDVFRENECFTVKVTGTYSEGEIASFDCLIYNDSEEEVASATVNVYQGDV